MREYIYVRKFTDLKKGDTIKCHIMNINNTDHKIIKEGIIQHLGSSITNTIIKDNSGQEITFTYINNNDKDINIYIERKHEILMDYLPDGILFYQ